MTKIFIFWKINFSKKKKIIAQITEHFWPTLIHKSAWGAIVKVAQNENVTLTSTSIAVLTTTSGKDTQPTYIYPMRAVKPINMFVCVQR